MKKTIYILAAIFLFSISPSIWAQPGAAVPREKPKKEMHKRIESARIAHITQRLDLSPDEAQKFWPVYNQFSKERRELHKNLRETHKKIDPTTASEKELRNLLDLQLTTKQKELDLEKKYTSKLLEVISTRQLVALRKAEGDFRDMIKDRIEKNRNQKPKTTMDGIKKRPTGLNESE